MKSVNTWYRNSGVVARSMILVALWVIASTVTDSVFVCIGGAAIVGWQLYASRKSSRYVAADQKVEEDVPSEQPVVEG